MLVAIDDLAAPAAPTGLAARAGLTTAVLNWTAAAMPGGGSVKDYAVFRNGIAIGRTAETRFSVAGLTEATGYVFTVAAVDALGRLAKSAPVALLTQAESV